MSEKTAKEIVTLLKARGYQEDHQTGDHHIFKNKAGKMISVPYTSMKDHIGIGMFKKLIELSNDDKDGKDNK